MNRRSYVFTLGAFILGLGVLIVLLVMLLRHEHRWYQKANLPPSAQRKQYSQEFYSNLSDGYERAANDDKWQVKFSDMQINSYLVEGFKQSGVAEQVLPEGISDPRVVFDSDRIHLGFRYGSGLFSSVISVDLRVWLVQKEQNVVAMELEGFHAGALPISAKSLLEKVAEVGRQNGIAVTWYRDRDTGHPVAILRIQDDQPHPTMQLTAIHLEPGFITIHGKATDVPGRNLLTGDLFPWQKANGN